MYKALLVDDEKLVGENIRKKVNWNQMGYELAGIMPGGKQAIDFVKKNKVDVVLTDLTMPVISGADLVNYLQEYYPQIKIIIISSYDSFNYVKQRLRNCEYSHLFKPVTAEELQRALQNIKYKFYNGVVQNGAALSDFYIADSYSVIKNNFLKDLLDGKLISEEVEKKKHEFAFTENARIYAAGIVRVNAAESEGDPAHDKNLFHVTVYHIIQRIIGKKNDGIVFHKKENEYLLIFKNERKEEFYENVIHLCEEIVHALERSLGFSSVVGLGKEREELSLIKGSVSEAKRAVEYIFVDRLKKVLCFEECTIVHSEVRIMQNLYKKIDMILEDQRDNLVGIKDMLSGVSERLQSLKVTKQQAYSYYKSIFMTFAIKLNSAEIGRETFDKLEYSVSEQLESCEYLDDMTYVLGHKLEILLIMSGKKDLSYGQRQAQLARQYIDANYRNSSLSLQTVSDHLAMSVSHFSAVFRENTGETFVESLTKKRIEAAKELLENTTLKTYEVAACVGYKDARYFGTAFKKVVGMTTKEYAKKYKNLETVQYKIN